MNKKYFYILGGIIAGIGVGLLGAALAVGLVFWKTMPPDCKNTLLSTVPSDTGSYSAFVFTRGCGATVKDSTQVSVLPSAEKFDNTLRGNIFISDEDPSLQVKWTGLKTLGIVSDPEKHVFKKETVVRDVDILYAKNSATSTNLQPNTQGHTGTSTSAVATTTGSGEVPVRKPLLSVPTKPIVQSSCVVGGCSNQLCVDSASGPVVSTCEYSESYACYKTATCERQTTGQCGWTQAPELKQCILSKSSTVLQVQ